MLLWVGHGSDWSFGIMGDVSPTVSARWGYTKGLAGLKFVVPQIQPSVVGREFTKYRGFCSWRRKCAFSDRCAWQGRKCNIPQMFTSVWTGVGMCFSFNAGETSRMVSETGATEIIHHLQGHVQNSGMMYLCSHARWSGGCFSPAHLVVVLSVTWVNNRGCYFLMPSKQKKKLLCNSISAVASWLCSIGHLALT